MSNSPLVSILIPVYNRESLLGESIQSALDQTITNIEIIISDNASTDNTWNVCKHYAERDTRIKIFRNDANLGPVRNWQRCISEAQGEYGKILFSDDLISATFLEETLPMMENPQTGLVFSSTYVNEQPWQGEAWYRWRKESQLVDSKEYITDILFGNSSVPISPGCALFRLKDLKRNLMVEIPSPSIHDFPNHGAGPDVLLSLLTAKDYPYIGYINKPVCFFRAHAGSITTSDRTNYLVRCYDQAKLWFSSQYEDSTLRQRLYARYWWKKSARRKRLLSMEAVFGDYLSPVPNIKFRDVIDYLFSKKIK